jgi:hypothetical protein
LHGEEYKKIFENLRSYRLRQFLLTALQYSGYDNKIIKKNNFGTNICMALLQQFLLSKNTRGSDRRLGWAGLFPPQTASVHCFSVDSADSQYRTSSKHVENFSATKRQLSFDSCIRKIQFYGLLKFWLCSRTRDHQVRCCYHPYPHRLIEFDHGLPQIRAAMTQSVYTQVYLCSVRF